MEMFGSPANFDSNACERMHKDIAKKPGRLSQKRHKTFTIQASSRLTERYLIDKSYNTLIDNQHGTPSKAKTTGEKANKVSGTGGSCFYIKFSPIIDGNGNVFIQSFIEGLNAIANSSNIIQQLPKDLVEFILLKIDKEYLRQPITVICRTEYVDDDNNMYRSHFNYRSEGSWYDWAMVRFLHDRIADKYSNVPAKLLCFLPHGLPGNFDFQVVCHPCQWKHVKVTNLITRWTKHASIQTINKGIPYELVPVKALCGHCLIIPDLIIPGAVYHMSKKEIWGQKFK
jgi:hypothetical protein